MVSDEALKKLQEQIMAWPMTQRFVVQQLIEDYRVDREDLRAYEATGLTSERCAEFARADAEGRYIVMRDAEQEGVAHLRELAEENEKLCEQIGEMETREQQLRAKNVALIEQLGQMNGEAINKANEIANLKADADALRNKLADTEAALGRANACIATMKVERDQQTKEIFEWQGSAQALHDDLLDARERANYAESHPWRNLWEWVKRKLVRHE